MIRRWLISSLLMLLLVGVVPAELSAQDGSGQSAEMPDVAEAAVTVDNVSADEIRIGDPLAVELSIRAPLGAEIIDVVADTASDVEIIRSALVDDSTSTLRWAVELAVFRPGTHRIRAFEVVYLDTAGARQTLRSSSLEVQVLRTLPDDAELVLHEPGEPRSVFTRNWTPVYAGIAVGVGLLLGLLALIWRQRKREREEPTIEVEPPRPAHLVALEALQALETSGWLESGRHLDYHMRLSEVLREYVGSIFAFMALEMTTTEIMSALRERAEEAGPYKAELERVLRDMDMVKFAKFEPPIERSRLLLEQVRAFVERVTEERKPVESDVPEPPSDTGLPDVPDDLPTDGGRR